MSQLFSLVCVLIFVWIRLHQPAPKTAVAPDPLNPLSGITSVIQGASHDLIVAALITFVLFMGFALIKLLFRNGNWR